MVDSAFPNPTSKSPPLTLSLPPPPPPPSPLPPPSQSCPPCHQDPAGAEGGSQFSVRRPTVRVTTEFDSESSLFFHKISCKLFSNLAKLKLSFQNDRNGKIAYPQLGFLTKHFSATYDLETRNALLKGSFDVGDALQVHATHDVKSGQVGVANSVHIGLSAQCLSVSCTCENNKSIVSCFKFGNAFVFKYQYRKEQLGEVSIVAGLNPSYKLELSSPVPLVGLPRATGRFPMGEISVEDRKDEEAEKVLSISGILKGQLLNGVSTALYRDEDLNLRYCYKDEEMTLIPSISLPSKAFSFAFKRRFSPSDKLSYWYHFDSNEWSMAYKHTAGKDLKLKAGYNSEARLGWASFWVGDEDGKAKTAPMKMKFQFMLQVPQDDITNPFLMFRFKKRWDL